MMLTPEQLISDRQARTAHNKALRQAFWRGIRARLGRSCNDLLSNEQVLGALDLEKHRNLGLQKVPVERIVGSARTNDFDLRFGPLREKGDGRWLSVAQARQEGIDLPPPYLYKVGDAYLVEDGNHRVSVARARGEAWIAAQVIEIDASALTPEASCTRLGLKLPESGPGQSC
ncbi:MAG: hypothetical protein R3293_24290 [Candidatus Promineifilaceae bacterium]|nr:hypothetical protein [Candidatus Promineifilaceae bacterium]